jgi:hypothetical protein
MWSRREHQWVLVVAHTSSEFSYMKRENSETYQKQPKYQKEICAQSTMPNIEVADITTGNTKPIVCQRCLQSFQEGTVLYFMQDRKSSVAGKHVCAGCHQYYLKKMESHQQEHTSSSYHSSLASLNDC